MISHTTVAVAVLLLSLGVISLVLAAVAGRYSVRGSGRRTAAMTILGIAALAGTIIILSSEGWPSVREEMLWPLAVYILAASSGVGIGAGLVYVLVAAR
ncbi:MAG: hypothetical protein KAQ96_14750 [Thermoplasmata archaeon]|nr:hypothetical protein [Thermoplasmata archaeon]